MDSKDSIPGPIIRWLESEIEPVYRYHLARSENYLEAQALAALTFQTALTWIHTRPMEEDRLRSWILTIARFEQSFGRWGASARKLQPAADPTRQPGENVTSPLMASTSFKDLPPEQAEVLLREQISRLSTLWKRLPRRQADALALHYFGGLTLAEVGVVLGKGEREATVWVSREASFERELFEIAANLHPSQELVASITSRVQEAAARPARQAALPARLARWLKADIWQFAFRAQSIFVAGSRAVQVGLLVGVLAAGFYIIQRQSIVPTQAQPTPSQTAAPTISVQLAAASLVQGAMLPPAPSVCQAWQKNLEDLVFASFSPTDSTAFSDPTSSNSAVSGTGCEIEAAISGNTEDSAPKTVSDIGQMFYNAGFSLNNGFDNIPGDPTSVFFPQNCPGFGRSYQKDDLYVFLSASYCPATGDPSSPISRAPGAPGVRGYTLRLIFSSNLVQTQFNHFLSLWAAGDNTAINSLSPALRRRFLNIQELDLMAGLSRSPSKTIQFTWQPVQNTGNSLKTEVVARVSDSRSLLSKPLPAFQMVLASENGQWAVSDASKTTVASSTEDSVILADAQGQIIQLSLANGLTTPLSAPGVYLPLVGSTNGFPSQISPDGHWLTLMQPGPGLQAGTWLVALDGRTALHFNNHDLNLAWSPDSLKIAYFDPIDPQVLKITTLSTGATATLARLNEIPISLAWSPAGDKIAVTYVESRLIFNPSGSAGTSTFVNIGLIPLASPKIQVLAQVEANMNTLSPGDLYWTPDGQELWYGPGEVAFNIRDGSAYPLIGQPLSGELANQQADLLHFVQPGQLLTHSPVSLLSPDWQNLAEVYSTTNSTNDYLAILPAAGSNSSPKNQCCLEYLGGIATFAWTGDGKDVVVYNGINGPGNLLLVNPTSGERQTAAEGIYYIGLVSSLKQAGLKLAPTVTVSRSPSTDISQTWSWVNNLVSGISLQVPTGWSVWQPGKDYAQGPVVVANFNFDNPFGFASLKPGDLYFKISKVPMGVGQTAAGWYSQIEAINQSGQIYEPVTIGGLRGFHRVMHVDLVPKDEFMLPVGDAIVVIDKYPLISDYDLVFKQILATLSFH